MILKKLLLSLSVLFLFNTYSSYASSIPNNSIEFDRKLGIGNNEINASTGITDILNTKNGVEGYLKKYINIE